jgi:hypothetical protein
MSKWALVSILVFASGLFFLIDSLVSDRKRVALGVALLFLGFIWAKSFGLFSKKA